MKYLLSLLVMLVVFDTPPVESSSSASMRIDMEAKADLRRIKVQILTEGGKMKNRIKFRTNSYEKQYSDLISEIDDRLNLRGFDGRIIGEQFKESIAETIEELKSVFTEQMNKPEVKNVIDNLREEFLDGFRQDIADIRAGAEDKRGVIKCWIDYREQSRLVYESSLKSITDIVDTESKDIDDTIASLKKRFTEALDKIDDDAACGADASCIRQYYSENSDKILLKLHSYLEEGENTAKNVMDELVGKLESVLQILTKSFEDLRQAIPICVENA